MEKFFVLVRFDLGFDFNFVVNWLRVFGQVVFGIQVCYFCWREVQDDYMRGIWERIFISIKYDINIVFYFDYYYFIILV